MLGYNVSNSLSLLIFSKALKYPSMTDKRYSITDIINYSQIDAQQT